MQKSCSSAKFALLALLCSCGAVGCSKDPELPPQAPQQEILAGAAKRAQPLLDKLEAMKPEERQEAMKLPRMSSTLAAASADPATKKRMEALGVHP